MEENLLVAERSFETAWRRLKRVYGLFPAPILIQGVWEAIGKLKGEGLFMLPLEQSAFPALKRVDFVHVMSKGQLVFSARPNLFCQAQSFLPGPRS